MKTFTSITFMLCVMASTACAPMQSAYRIEPAPVVGAGAPRVAVLLLEDARAEDEKTGAGAGLFNKSTKDALYSDNVSSGITTALIDELRARGIDATSVAPAPIHITGRIANYRAFIVPPRTAFIPYVSYVTWIWTHDKLSAGVVLDLKVTTARGTILEKRFSASRNADEWVGIAGLASTARRLDQETLVKFLQAGLKDCLTKAADEITPVVRNAR